MSEWKTKKLGEVMDIKRGGSPRPIKKYITDSPDGINWIKISDATSSNKYIYKTKEKIKPSGLAKTRIVEEGDFILSNSMSFGKPYIVKTRGAIHDGWLLLKDKSQKHFESEFLYYLLSSSFIYNQFQLLAAGTTVKNLNVDLVSSVYVPIPPLPKQRHIVSKLDALFAEIDAAIALIDENTAKAEALKLSVLDEEFTREYRQKKVEKIKNLIHKTENINPKSIYGRSNFTYIDISSINKERKEIEKPKISQGSNAPNRAKKAVLKGDVLFATTRPNLRNVAIVHMEYENPIASTGFCILRPKTEILNTSYLFFYLISNTLQDSIQPFIRGAQYPAISDKDLKGVSIALPPLIMQEKAVRQLYSIYTKVDNLIHEYTDKRESLEALKSSILDKAFKGEL